MDQPSFKRHLSSTSSNSSVWEPFQEERIKARAVDEDTQKALANVGLKARMNVDRGYHTPISSENHPNLGSKPIFRTTTSINSQVERSAPLWSRTQSAPHFQELQPFAISNSSSGLDPMEEEWIQSRRKGNGSEMDSISASSSQSGEMMMDENQPIGVSNGPIQVKRGREFGEADRDDVLGRWAEEDGGAVPNLSTSSSTLESTSFPPEPSTSIPTFQRTISALPSRSMNPPLSKDGELGRRPLSRPTQSMPVSTGFFNDPYSGLGASNSNLNLGGDQRSPDEIARHLYEASLAKMDRKYDFNSPAQAAQRVTKMESNEDGDAQMEDLGPFKRSPDEIARHLYEASLAKMDRKYDFNSPAQAAQRVTKMESNEDGDAQMEDLGPFIQNPEGF